MKIHAYRVMPDGAGSLEPVLQFIEALPLEQRLREITGAQLRLEEADHRGPLWFLDFGMLKQEGPGKGSATAPISDFDLEDDEGFGHETAACFDTRNGFLILQYNHYGPRQARISYYLNRFAVVSKGADENDITSYYGNPPFDLVTVLKSNALERLDSAGIVKSVEISLYVPGIRASDGHTRASLVAY